jgi:acyl-CoA reductase-like NAD-dependent aldehyde dehydrogenase
MRQAAAQLQFCAGLLNRHAVKTLHLQDGIQKVAEPIGIIAGIVPTTNPTSTVIFKCLLALKTRCVWGVRLLRAH